jgi:hypothetical protein
MQAVEEEYYNPAVAGAVTGSRSIIVGWRRA